MTSVGYALDMRCARALGLVRCVLLLVSVAACGRLGFESLEVDTDGLSGTALGDDAPPASEDGEGIDGTGDDGVGVGDGDGDAPADDGDATPLPRPPHDTCEDPAGVVLSSTNPTATVHLESAGARDDYALACCGSRPELLVQVEVPSYFLLLMCTGTPSVDVVVLDGCPGAAGECLRLDCSQDQAVLPGASGMTVTTTVTLGVCPTSADAIFDLLLTADWGA